MATFARFGAIFRCLFKQASTYLHVFSDLSLLNRLKEGAMPLLCLESFGVAKLQSIYSLTVHTAQVGRFGSVFLDLPDIRNRERTNLPEAQQMLYVAVTRPSKRLIVVE